MEDDNNTASKLIEIKEILRNCEKAINEASGYNDTTDELLDYITNLQHTEDLYNQLLKDYDELQQENERLKIDNKILKQNNINEVLRNDLDLCVKDLKKANKKIEKLEDYKSRIEKAKNQMQLIRDLGFDYDGFNDVENLKLLIDELVRIAGKSINILNDRSDT